MNAVVKPSFSTQWFKLIVLGMHIVFIGVLLGLFFYHDVSYQIRTFSNIAPVSALYDNQNIMWLGMVREIAHGVLTIFDLLGGIMLVKYGLTREHAVTKIFAICIGSQIILSGLLSATLLGLVMFGGIWHLISAGAAIAMAGSAAITFAALALFWPDLNALARKQDEYVKDRP